MGFSSQFYCQALGIVRLSAILGSGTFKDIYESLGGMKFSEELKRQSAYLDVNGIDITYFNTVAVHKDLPLLK